jgi:hypothetical protein
VVNIIPDEGFKIKDVKVNGLSVGRVQHYSFKNVTAPQTIEAEFEAGIDYFDLSTVLPVKWLSFSGNINSEKSVELLWRVADEVNVAKYIIERSADGSNFSEIASVSRSSIQTYEKRYTHIDQNPLVGSNFYRIRQLDNINKFIYSKILKIENNSKAEFLIIPNPAQGFVHIKSNAIIKAAYLTQADGKVIPLTSSQGRYNLSVFAKGWYTITIVTNEGLQSQPLLVN